MIIRSKAPLRIGIAGGGTDVAPYSDTYGGLVLNATINLYAHCTIEETDEATVSILSHDTGTSETLAAAERLDTSAGARLVKGVYNRVVRDYAHRPLSMRITTSNDAPAGSGLGSSSTMVVCILKAFTEWLNLPLGDYELAHLAYEIERIDLQLSGGKQDQYAAAFGGFNYMEFRPDGVVIVNPLKVKRWIVDELEASTLLYFTGRSRASATIIDEQARNTREGNRPAVEAMHRIKQSAVDTKAALLRGDTGAIARLLGEAWEDKKRMARGITTPVIDEAMTTALAAGALSGKVSGAGGGGFILFVVEPTRKPLVEEALRGLGGEVVRFCFSDGGAHGWKRW